MRWVSSSFALLAATVFAGGCSSNEGKKGADGKPGEDDHHHHADHAAIGPHDGMLIEWGAHVYHVELVVDRAKQEATVHLLDTSLTKAAPIDAAEIALTLDSLSGAIPLKAISQQEDPAGKSSRFVGKHEALGGANKLKGSVTGTADGTFYSGSFDEAAIEKAAAKTHEDHGHDHKDHDHKDQDHKDHDHGDHEHKDHADHDHEAK